MTWTLREIGRADCPLLEHIDRAERIDEHYVLVDGQLEIVGGEIDVPGWHREEIAAYVPRLVGLLDVGGVVLGAWDGDRIVGLGSLDPRPVGGDATVVKLDMLHVSRNHRGQGVGHALTFALAERARDSGAKRLYISATPTRGTVDAYRAMGAVVAPEPDPELLRLEPDDIHLLLPL